MNQAIQTQHANLMREAIAGRASRRSIMKRAADLRLGTAAKLGLLIAHGADKRADAMTTAEITTADCINRCKATTTGHARDTCIFSCL